MDRAAFHALYERYSHDVYRFALYLSGHHAQAEDIVAETFMRAWTGVERIRPRTVKAYLFSIARNLVREERRANDRATEIVDDPSDPFPDPAAQAGDRSELRDVLRALQLLPDSDRAVLLMHVQDRMPHDEIARALGLSVAAVRVKVHRARIALGQLKIRQARLP
jgi:RNA polymerase sigma-70 factor (ECF subfamily)